MDRDGGCKFMWCPNSRKTKGLTKLNTVNRLQPDSYMTNSLTNMLTKTLKTDFLKYPTLLTFQSTHFFSSETALIHGQVSLVMYLSHTQILVKAHMKDQYLSQFSYSIYIILDSNSHRHQYQTSCMGYSSPKKNALNCLLVLSAVEKQRLK